MEVRAEYMSHPEEVYTYDADLHKTISKDERGLL